MWQSLDIISQLFVTQLFLDLHFQKLCLVDSKSTSFRASKDTGPVVSDKTYNKHEAVFHMGSFVNDDMIFTWETSCTTFFSPCRSDESDVAG